MPANHLRGLSDSELNTTVELAWEKTFDLGAPKKLPARIRASAILGPTKRPVQR